MSDAKSGYLNLLQQFSIPLLTGVFVALFAANSFPVWYEHALQWQPIDGFSLLGHPVSFHFISNEIFMVFFFGIAAKEITESFLPGGSLNPVRNAISPLAATLGGVIGPIGVFFAGLWMCFQTGIYDPSIHNFDELARGWGIPTATDIALAWLAARAVFGKGHPAIPFLLLLAVADDAIGLVIIAIFYGDSAHPVAPIWLLLVLGGIGVAYLLRRAGVSSWLVYVGIAGPLSWVGLVQAHLHPALALAVIIPFLPGPKRDTGLFLDVDEVDEAGEQMANKMQLKHSPLHQFEHQTKLFVDLGLFFFAFANAGVVFESIGTMTWLILTALVVGKTGGIWLTATLIGKLGFSLPDGMDQRDLLMAGFIAALGLTVALFVAAEAFVDPTLQGQAKMGALFSGLVGIVAVVLGRLLGLGQSEPQREV